jgi:cyclic beta-1,2-glucan synthetase
MLNPLTHARSEEGLNTYKVEPYAVAADVYTAAGHLGRGGWTWYTGSAAWTYRVALESILGFDKRGATLRIEPRVPSNWPDFTIDYRYGSSTYAITVHQPGRVSAGGALVQLDGSEVEDGVIPLEADGGRHEVHIRPR